MQRFKSICGDLVTMAGGHPADARGADRSIPMVGQILVPGCCGLWYDTHDTGNPITGSGSSDLHH